MTAAPRTSTRRASALARRIAELREAERTYTQLVAEACAEALVATTSVGYERASRRANTLEAAALRLGAQRQALERECAARAA